MRAGIPYGPEGNHKAYMAVDKMLNVPHSDRSRNSRQHYEIRAWTRIRRLPISDR